MRCMNRSYNYPAVDFAQFHFGVGTEGLIDFIQAVNINELAWKYLILGSNIHVHVAIRDEGRRIHYQESSKGCQRKTQERTYDMVQV